MSGRCLPRKHGSDACPPGIEVPRAREPEAGGRHIFVLVFLAHFLLLLVFIFLVFVLFLVLLIHLGLLLFRLFLLFLLSLLLLIRGDYAPPLPLRPGAVLGIRRSAREWSTVSARSRDQVVAAVLVVAVAVAVVVAIVARGESRGSRRAGGLPGSARGPRVRLSLPWSLCFGSARREDLREGGAEGGGVGNWARGKKSRARDQGAGSLSLRVARAAPLPSDVSPKSSLMHDCRAPGRRLPAKQGADRGPKRIEIHCPRASERPGGGQDVKQTPERDNVARSALKPGPRSGPGLEGVPHFASPLLFPHTSSFFSSPSLSSILLLLVRRLLPHLHTPPNTGA